LQYDLLTDGLASHMWFATMAMHTYGHEWVCQLVYNQWLIEGLGLSDGEGTEKLWSCSIELIGIECSSSVSDKMVDMHMYILTKIS
jgi:hypothetical protein